MTHCLMLVFHGHPVNILLYCSCLCCHLDESRGIFHDDNLWWMSSFLYLSSHQEYGWDHFNRFNHVAGRKMYRSTLPCRIWYTFVCETVRMKSNILRLLCLPKITHKMLAVYLCAALFNQYILDIKIGDECTMDGIW